MECNIRNKDELDDIIRAEISDTITFLKEHRYDPSEIYEGELLEELKSVPDPAKEPLNIINNFIDVLDSMGNVFFNYFYFHTALFNSIINKDLIIFLIIGGWCANKAALSSLFIIEKLKLKTPYERHFLLLCVVSSLMLRIR